MIRLLAVALLAVAVAATPTAAAAPVCTSDQVPEDGQCIRRSAPGRPEPENPVFAMFPGANPNLPPGLTPANIPMILPLGLTPRNVPSVLPLGLTPQNLPTG